MLSIDEQVFFFPQDERSGCHDSVRHRDDFPSRHSSLCYRKDILSLTQAARFMVAETKILPLIIDGL